MVLGMHRSGTSALTRVLNLLGADLPEDLIPANRFNRSGYWEPSQVVALNDHWLNSAKAAWDAPYTGRAPLDAELPSNAVLRAADTVKEAYGTDHALIALKDPRCTLFFDTWRAGIERAGYTPRQLLIYRDAGEVAQSLARRDGFSDDEAGLLWCWYGLKALTAIRDRGGVVVAYSDLRGDWRRVIKTIQAEWSLASLSVTPEQEAAVDAFLTEPASRPEANFSASVQSLIDDVGALYLAAVRGKSLDGIEALLDEADRLSGVTRSSVLRLRKAGDAALKAAIKERDAARQTLNEVQEALTAERDDARQTLVEVEEALKAERDEARQTLAEVEEALKAERDEARQTLVETEARLTNERDLARQHYLELETRLTAERDAERRSLESANAALASERDQARQALAQTEARLTAERDEARAELDAKDARAAKAEQEVDRLIADFQSLEASVHAYADQAQSLEAQLKQTQADYVAADAERQALRIEAVRLKAIEQSSIWKATTPVRAVMARLPGVRHWVRRGLKAAWWTATGQLGARLKARQASELAAQLDASRAEPGGSPSTGGRSSIKTLNGVLTEEFGDAASYIPELISRYELSFQSEGQAPIKTVVGDAPARKMAERLAKITVKRLETDAPDVSIVIPAYNQISYTLACIESVFASAPKASFEILVGDDQSTDGTQAAASVPMAHVRWVRHETNQGFVGNCNLTAEKARGRIVLMLNNDTLVLPDWLDTLVDTLDADPKAGLVGSKLIYPDGRLQEAGGIFWQDGSAWNLGRFDHPRRPEFSYARDADYISGASIAVPRALWEKLGGFDDHYRPAYAEDADLAFRIRAEGLRTVFQPRSMLIHFEGVSSGTDLAAGAKAYQVKNLEKLRERWAGVLAAHRPNAQEPEREKERAVTKRVLFIDLTTPEPQHDAGSLVAVETMRALQGLGFKVTFVPVDNFLWTKAYSAPLQAMGVETIYHPFYSRFEPFISARGGEFDLVVVHRFGAAERVMGALRTHAPQAKIAFMPADLHFLREQREADLSGDAAAQGQAAETKRRELSIIRSADAVLPHSNLEIDLLKAEAPETPPFKLPLIHDPDPVASGFHGRSGVGFIGGYGHPPNVDAVDWFMSEIWPRVREQKPDARFVLAGSKMPDRFKSLDGKNGVEVLGFVDTIDEFFGGVRASLAPLRYGAGAKGKVAASLALGTPCVSTSIGAEGMGLTPGVDVLVADDPEGFARHILAMLDDENRWNELRQAGLDFARRETSREVVRERLSDMLGQLHLD